MVLQVGPEITYHPKRHCNESSLIAATHASKSLLTDFVNSMKKSAGFFCYTLASFYCLYIFTYLLCNIGHTNHSLGFAAAFAVLSEGKIDDSSEFYLFLVLLFIFNMNPLAFQIRKLKWF